MRMGIREKKKKVVFSMFIFINKAGWNCLSIINATFKTAMCLFIVAMLYYIFNMLYYILVNFLKKEWGICFFFFFCKIVFVVNICLILKLNAYCFFHCNTSFIRS
jgi:hypothetical protein